MHRIVQNTQAAERHTCNLPQHLVEVSSALESGNYIFLCIFSKILIKLVTEKGYLLLSDQSYTLGNYQRIINASASGLTNHILLLSVLSLICLYIYLFFTHHNTDYWNLEKKQDRNLSKCDMKCVFCSTCSNAVK